MKKVLIVFKKLSSIVFFLALLGYPFFSIYVLQRFGYDSKIFEVCSVGLFAEAVLLTFVPEKQSKDKYDI